MWEPAVEKTRSSRVRAVAAVVIAAVAVTGCSDPEVITTPDERPDAAEVPAEEVGTDDGEAEPGGEANAPAVLGETITLTGSDVEVAVTPRRVLDPAPTGEWDTPSAGSRYVAVEFSLHNSGDSPYSDSPSNGMVLIDDGDRQYSSTLADAEGCGRLGGGVRMAEGDTRVGCVVFELPDGVTPAALQVALDSGFASATGRWDLASSVEPGEVPPSTADGMVVGESRTLEGSDTSVEVTLVRVLDPATPGEWDTPDAGHRVVAVELRLANNGDEVYSDSPGNGAVLVDAAYHQYSEGLMDVSDCQGFGGSVTVAPGDARVGCLTFEVSEGVALSAFQFALDSGFAGDTGRWLLG